MTRKKEKQTVFANMIQKSHQNSSKFIEKSIENRQESCPGRLGERLGASQSVSGRLVSSRRFVSRHLGASSGVFWRPRANQSDLDQTGGVSPACKGEPPPEILF